MDIAANVPRWTPSPSPTRSLLKEPETKAIPSKREASVDDLELQSIVSEEDGKPAAAGPMFPFSTGLTTGPDPPPYSGTYEASSMAIDMNEGTNYDGGKGLTSKGSTNGLLLTWTELWVTVPDGKNGGRPILQGLTGYAEPGEILAIMGPSGSGKTTLLDALAGRLSSNTHQTGEILINGRKETLVFGTSAYVTQDDILMTTLTVREAVHYSAQLQLPHSMPTSEKKERAEITIREMGLQGSADTRIGGWSVKGISGGQKRRVSICIEILTRPKLLFLDEPTSGLDSASSYHVVNHIVKLARQDGRTIVASIHQPSSEVFELFHNLCLLSSGETIYFGPVSMAEQFFSSNGFPCPTLRNPSDHYLRTINTDFDMDVEQGHGGSTGDAISILVKSYKSSEISQRVYQRAASIRDQKGGIPEKKGSQASFITQCLVLTERSFINMYRDLGYYWLRLGVYIALCLCVGTIYYDIGLTFGSIQARGSMLMFVAAFLTFMAIGGFPSFVEDMKIFGRERLNGHYGVGAFVVGNTLSSIPYLLMISLIPGAMAYYLVGLQKSLEHFVCFALLLFVCMMLVESLMMIVASIVPDFLMGIITGAGIQGVMMLNGGFFRLPDDLPKPFWRYPMYYIAFHKYANQGVYKNEFQGVTFPNNIAGGPPTITGDEILKNTWQVETGYSKWIDIAILFGMVILYRLMFFGILKLVEKAYVTQDDTLMTTLTVREAVHYSAQLQLPDSMPTSEKRERAEITIREMGLQGSADTRIGGWSVKGISGGQKRRVSICIEILTRPKLLFLDEPTSGLDSAASYHVMKHIVKLARQDGRTIVASIHQPSSEVFELFHNLCLLSSGKTVYFGPVSMAEQFFSSNGFPCPTLRNPSDHYLRTINADFDMDIEQGHGGSTEEAISVLVKSYKSSDICLRVCSEQLPYATREFNLIRLLFLKKGGIPEKKGSQASFITQCLVLTERSFINMYRDLGYYWLRLGIYIALCLCVGTIFYDIDLTFGSIQARGSMLMFVAGFLTFMAISGFLSFVEDMKIFGRERLNGHYDVGAFVVGNMLSSIPYLLMISLIPGAMAYYLVGLQKSLEHFVCFALILFVCMMLVESLMMIVASIMQDFLMGIITGAGIQGVMMLNGGFFRLPDDLPKPF
ncbi:hypothetical protein SADUNF_Sadunf05G0046900 [Salix dunnii]|uniref:ABC transporter domain-containing protein n=1 Tax=Salix dunnii TaxID=1413687 RepID=A0A835N1S9_9ROSI|nr:hypothetical protein SADUNF_Sadunf05G0046900 [Salix dunnii]